jgi:hypothetical protein
VQLSRRDNDSVRLLTVMRSTFEGSVTIQREQATICAGFVGEWYDIGSSMLLGRTEHHHIGAALLATARYMSDNNTSITKIDLDSKEAMRCIAAITCLTDVH